MVNLNCKVDTSRFDATFKEFTQWNKRNPDDLANKNAFEVAKICTKTIKFVPRDVIRASLNMPTRISPSLRICELLANKQRIAKGEKALSGNKLRVEGNKYIRSHLNSSKFLVAGMIPAIKDLAPFVKSKSAGNASIKTFGRPKGGGSPATGEQWIAKASIWNAVQGGFKKWWNAPRRNIEKVQAIIREGMQAALNTKEADMRVYIERKMNQAIQKFNNS